jgi:hypothetical protein
MDPLHVSKIPAQLVPCGPGCRYAEPLHGHHHEWIWCTRPAATNRVRSLDSDCHWFTPPPPLEPPKIR